MTFPSPEPMACQEAAAWNLLDQMRVRATVNRAVGILQVQRVCGREEARDHLRDSLEQAVCSVKAARMITIVNATAESRADPDVRWD
ncbi:hypothetical protein [Amycolatopsis oliviviridis]|nr:hypothetical protein [Amycolatopsis oliviviridis]